MASITTSFFGSYDVTVDISAPTTTIDVSTQTIDDSFHDNSLQENRQEFRVLPREIIKFIEDKIKAAQKNSGVMEIQMDVDLFQFRKWDNQLDRIFQNSRQQERWILTRDITQDSSGANIRELRLTRRTTPITLVFPLN